MEKDCRFAIDFFEFSFLVEACIPPRPIARAMFWIEVIDKYYNVMTQNERDRLFEWMRRNDSYIHQLEKDNEDVQLFDARFDPTNQYLVTAELNEKVEQHECFFFNHEYHTSSNRFINFDYIIKIEKI